jgi:HlyD family secretion protein
VRKRWILGAAGVLLVSGTLAVWPRSSGGAGEEAPSGRHHTVRRGDLLLSVRETGILEPLAQVVVKSKVAGRLLSFTVAEGASVSQGQLLATIDPVEIQSQVAQINAQIDAARAGLSQARTQLGIEERSSFLALQDAAEARQAAQARLLQASRQAEAQPSLTRAAIDQANANLLASSAALAALRDTQTQARADARSALDQAEASAENARKGLTRLRALLAQGFVSQNQLDDAQRDDDLAQAQLRAARQRWESLDEQHAAQRRQAEAEVRQAEAALATAKANGVQDGLRQDEVTAARAARSQATVAFEQARAARAQVEARRAAVRAAQAEVKRLQDQLQEMQVRLTDTRILAPMAGTVTRRYVEPGELVTSGIATFSTGTPLLQIAQLSRMRVVCLVNEVDVGAVRIGQKARVRLDAARGGSYSGKVVSVAASAGARALAPEATSPGGAGAAAGAGIVKFEVKIDLLGGDEKLKPGMSASVDIAVGERRGVLLLPLDAVEESGEGSFVTRLKGQKQERVKVKPGLRSERDVEIVAGVKEGETILEAPWKGAARRGLDSK